MSSSSSSSYYSSIPTVSSISALFQHRNISKYLTLAYQQRIEQFYHTVIRQWSHATLLSQTSNIVDICFPNEHYARTWDDMTRSQRNNVKNALKAALLILCIQHYVDLHQADQDFQQRCDLKGFLRDYPQFVKQESQEEKFIQENMKIHRFILGVEILCYEFHVTASHNKVLYMTICTILADSNMYYCRGGSQSILLNTFEDIFTSITGVNPILKGEARLKPVEIPSVIRGAAVTVVVKEESKEKKNNNSSSRIVVKMEEEDEEDLFVEATTRATLFPCVTPPLPIVTSAMVPYPPSPYASASNTNSNMTPTYPWTIASQPCQTHPFTYPSYSNQYHVSDCNGRQYDQYLASYSSPPPSQYATQHTDNQCPIVNFVHNPHSYHGEPSSSSSSSSSSNRSSGNTIEELDESFMQVLEEIASDSDSELIFPLPAP